MTLAASLPALFSDEHGPALVAVLLTPPVLAAVLFAAAFLAQHGSRLAALWLMALGSVQPVVRLVALLLVLDATLHAGLVPAHAGHAALLAVLFGLDALALLLVAIWTTVAEGWEPVALALLVANLVAYALFVDTGREAADVVGLGCKLLELFAIALIVAQTIRWTDARVSPAATSRFR